MERYLKEHDLEMAGDKGSTGNISAFLRVVSSVVATNGVVISALALFILTLSIFLLLQKSKDTIRKLMFMGFPPLEISRYYETIVIGANTAITLIATAATLCCRQLWKGQLE